MYGVDLNCYLVNLYKRYHGSPLTFTSLGTAGLTEDANSCIVCILSGIVGLTDDAKSL